MPQHVHFQKFLRWTWWPVGVETTELDFYFTQDCTRKGKVEPGYLTFELGQTGDLWGNGGHHQECLRAHREAGILSIPRKHTSVSWMKLFWLKPGQPDRLEKRKLTPVIHTRPFSLSVLPFLLLPFLLHILNHPFPSKSYSSCKAQLTSYLFYDIFDFPSQSDSFFPLFISTVHLCGFFLPLSLGYISALG